VRFFIRSFVHFLNSSGFSLPFGLRDFVSSFDHFPFVRGARIVMALSCWFGFVVGLSVPCTVFFCVSPFWLWRFLK